MSDQMDYRNEQILVSYVLHNLNKLYEIDSGLFVSPKTKAIYAACKETNEKQLAFSFDTLTSIAVKSYPSIGPNDIQTIYDNYSDFQNLDYHLQLQKDYYLKEVDLPKIFEDIHVEQKKKGGRVNRDFLITKLNSAISIINSDAGSDLDILSSSEWMDVHRRGDEARQKDLHPKSIGWSTLDKLIKQPMLAGEITTIAAPSGMGKSIFVLNVIYNLIRRNTPVLSINTEMGAVTNADRFIGLWGNIQSDSIIQRNRSQAITDKIEATRQEISKNNYIHYKSKRSLYISDIDKMIYRTKEKMMDLKAWDFENPYMVVTLDLFELLLDIKMKDANLLAKAVDDLHRMLEKHTINENPYVSFLIVTQIGETLFRDTSFRKRFKTMDDLDDFTFSVEDIYGSSGFTQRSRTVLTLSRPQQLKRKFFPMEAETLDPQDDQIYVNSGKSTHGGIGVCKMWFNTETGKMHPVSNEPYSPNTTNNEQLNEPNVVRRVKR